VNFLFKNKYVFDFKIKKLKKIMNTQIKLWIEPMEMSHERCNNRVYFNCIIEGDETTKNNAELEDLLSGRIINS